MVGLTKRAAGRLVNEGERDLLKSNNVGIGIHSREDIERVRHLLLVQILNHGALERLPNIRLRDGIHHVNEDGIEDGTAHGLERKGNGLFLLGNGRVLGLLDRKKHTVNGRRLLTLLGLDGEGRVEHE